MKILYPLNGAIAVLFKYFASFSSLLLLGFLFFTTACGSLPLLAPPSAQACLVDADCGRGESCLHNLCIQSSRQHSEPKPGEPVMERSEPASDRHEPVMGDRSEPVDYRGEPTASDYHEPVVSDNGEPVASDYHETHSLDASVEPNIPDVTKEPISDDVEPVLEVDPPDVCVEQKEICDEKDNDCDGEIDEDFVKKGQPCVVGKGSCRQTGNWICDTASFKMICSVVPGLPEKEICDGKDNNCDGMIDNITPQDFPDCKIQKGVCKGSKKGA